MDETDRVRRLVDRMEAFSDDAPPERSRSTSTRCSTACARWPPTASPRACAEGSYDPSLPPVWGEEDQLIQIFLNLVKNAAEAAHSRRDGRGEVTDHHGLPSRVRVRAATERRARGAPLEVRVQDNGPGVPPTPARPSVRAVRHLQGERRWPRPGAGRQAGRRPRRPDRLRIRARPHRLPRPPARRARTAPDEQRR